MRKLLIPLLLLFVVLPSAFAGGRITHRMRNGQELTFLRHQALQPVSPSPDAAWDANKIYRIPVVLFSFADCDFSWDDPHAYYDRMFNERGYNLGVGPGCVADYFLAQSGGLFHVQFDVIGPVKLSSKQKSSGTAENRGYSQITEALQAVDPEVDYSLYDWDGAGAVHAVILIYAGYGGNELTKDNVTDGCIWPNSGYLGVSADGVRLRYFSVSNELWSNNASAGIGTIIHEYCHTFGLADLYPTSDNSSEYAVVDEWDLMDGGCYSGDGWCPVNLSSHERELMKWQTPVDLITTTDVTDMPPFDQSGLAYRILNDAYPNEFYLLENRQHVGWDLMLPGHGLVIAHVDYDDGVWEGNSVNADPAHHRYDLFHADGLDFNYFQSLYGTRNKLDAYGRSIRLQHSPYPFTDSLGVVNRALTDTTVPAAHLYHARSDGSLFMGKPITQIQETGSLISFHFSDSPDAITTLPAEAAPLAVYDLHGHSLPFGIAEKSLSSGLYIIKYSDGTTKKCIRR